MFSRLKAAAILSALVSMSSADACTFSNLPINPISPDNTDIFLGASEIIDVRFNNEKTEGNVDVFPDSPLIITNKKTNSTCSIDGGVWVRKDVYVSDDGMVVLAHEFSGSNDFLSFYDTRSCRKIGGLDISDSTWRLGEGDISVSRPEAANGKESIKLRMYPLSEYCTEKH